MFAAAQREAHETRRPVISPGRDGKAGAGSQTRPCCLSAAGGVRSSERGRLGRCGPSGGGAAAPRVAGTSLCREKHRKSLRGHPCHCVRHDHGWWKSACGLTGDVWRCPLRGGLCSSPTSGPASPRCWCIPPRILFPLQLRQYSNFQNTQSLMS